MRYILVDVRIRRVKVYSNQIYSWMIGGQIRVIARTIIENSTFYLSNKSEYDVVVRNRK
jgi:hypothetical protein